MINIPLNRAGQSAIDIHIIMSNTNFINIVSRFSINGGAGDVTPFGSGHINDTYLVKNTATTQPDYLLQRINHHVFKNVPGLMLNFRLATEHIRAKLQAAGSLDIDQKVVTLIPTLEGDYFIKDEEGNYWRMCLFIPNTRSYDLVTTTTQAYEGGRGFGQFQTMLADMDASNLIETIPDFHHIISRLEKFETAVKADQFGRAKEVENEMDFIRQRTEAMSTIIKLGREGKIPLRVTHNDTKFNNVLLNEADEAQCVIDLDTVMPGYVAYDFGDAVRTIINTAKEDEADLDKINLNIPLFEAFVKGYLQEAGSILTPAEIGSLLAGGLLLPYIQGVRFLTDYLEGDHYFKTKFPEHNLQRTRAQFKLVSRMEENYEQLNLIINNMAQTIQQDRSIAS